MGEEPLEGTENNTELSGATVPFAPVSEEAPDESEPVRSRTRVDGLRDALREPHSRARFIIWFGVGVLALAAFMILALGATSTYWFCANVCHKVQDDTIIAYDRSTHNKVSCMSCHEPVNANPVVFVMKKAEALGELYLTATNQYELPLNPESELSKEMSSEQCTQCHAMENRPVNPTEGIIIDHEIHAENDITCTTCHNRVAHKENFQLTLAAPNGEPNRKHEDFMKMEACFRCHGQEEDAKAPGDCYACHPKGFKLKPDNHETNDFYNKFGTSDGHWKLYEKDPDYCPTCHTKKFCTDCHGVVMPHPKGFEKTHGKVGKKSPETCANCHAKTKETSGGLEFCNSCHHKQSDPTKPWIPQHYKAARAQGAQACFECHNPTFCAKCHVKGATD